MTARLQTRNNIAINKKIDEILSEILQVLRGVSNTEVERLAVEIMAADKIIGVGAGRVGMAVKSFMMRLGHFGLRAYMWGDATVPSCGRGDLVLAASGSGETQIVFDLVKIAKENGAKVLLISGNSESRMGKLADAIVKIEAPSKTKQVADYNSVQPMTTLNEQCLGIFFDAMVLLLMERMGEDHDSMWKRHSNLE